VKEEATKLPNDLALISSQLDSLKNSLNQIHISIDQTKDQLPTYFDQVRLAIILVIIGFLALAAVFILAGVSTLSMRKALIQIEERKQKE